MESAEAKVSVYVFKSRIAHIERNYIVLELGNGVDLSLTVDESDTANLCINDFATIKVELPCPPLPNTNPREKQ